MSAFGGPSRTVSISVPSFYVQEDFFDGCQALRQELEMRLSSATRPNVPLGELPLGYLYLPDGFQCLAAAADRFFNGDLIMGFINRLRSWSRERFQLSHVSSPVIRIYVNGNHRNLLRDDVCAKLHYMLALSKVTGHHVARVKILYDLESVRKSSETPEFGQILSMSPSFNQLLIHPVENAYAVDNTSTSPDPAHGNVFLEGYLW
ncbi:MAG: hypothetical protein WBE47_15660 [Candidatus Acidiferrales bacterium]